MDSGSSWMTATTAFRLSARRSDRAQLLTARCLCLMMHLPPYQPFALPMVPGNDGYLGEYGTVLLFNDVDEACYCAPCNPPCDDYG